MGSTITQGFTSHHVVSLIENDIKNEKNISRVFGAVKHLFNVKRRPWTCAMSIYKYVYVPAKFEKNFKNVVGYRYAWDY